MRAEAPDNYTPVGLRASVEPLLYGRVSAGSRQRLYASLLNYSFRGCVQSDVRKVIAEESLDFDLLTWRRNLRRNGNLLRDCKVWAWFHFHGSARGVDASPSDEDKRVLRAALRSDELGSHLTSLKDEYGAPRISLQDLDIMLQDSLYSKDVLMYMRHLVSTKMSFLVRSFGFTKTDLLRDLQLSALYLLLKSYPRYEDVGHMRAICKAQAHNTTINIIKENTSESRQRLVRHSDGTHSSLMVPISEFGSENFYAGEGASEDVIAASYLVTGIDGSQGSTWERNFALEEALNDPKLSARHKQFLSLMLGEPSAAFSDFLGVPNSEAIDTMRYDHYMNRVCKFMKVRPENAEQLLRYLKSIL